MKLQVPFIVGSVEFIPIPILSYKEFKEAYSEIHIQDGVENGMRSSLMV